MSRLVDGLSVLLLLAAVGAFAAGFWALGEEQDLRALYWLIVGALALKASVDMLQPSRGS